MKQFKIVASRTAANGKEETVTIKSEPCGFKTCYNDYCVLHGSYARLFIDLANFLDMDQELMAAGQDTEDWYS